MPSPVPGPQERGHGTAAADSTLLADFSLDMTGNLGVFGEGTSMGPLTPRLKAELEHVGRGLGIEVSWTRLSEYLRHVERRGAAQNVASFIGAGTSRWLRRPPRRTRGAGPDAPGRRRGDGRRRDLAHRTGTVRRAAGNRRRLPVHGRVQRPDQRHPRPVPRGRCRRTLRPARRPPGPGGDPGGTVVFRPLEPHIGGRERADPPGHRRGEPAMAEVRPEYGRSGPRNDQGGGWPGS
jgi:hypothetical protein